MPVEISARFAFELDQPTDVLLQFEAANLPEQHITHNTTNITGDTQSLVRIPAQDGIGERIWLHATGRICVDYTACAGITRLAPDIAVLDAMALHDLPGEVATYLFDSRYCPADQMQGFVVDEFAGSAGGARIAAIMGWISDKFQYEPGHSTPDTTAIDSFVDRRGICRDFAHVLIMLARASAIPARYVSCYAPGVTPQDFHAVAEVFLADPQTPGGGAWYLVDATGMATAEQAAKIGIGRDAADVSFLTSFGPSTFLESAVSVCQQSA